MSLRQQDYESAIRDETQAIQLDPRLPRAYFLRGAAFGGLGDSREAVSDLQTAVPRSFAGPLREEQGQDRFPCAAAFMNVLSIPW